MKNFLSDNIISNITHTHTHTYIYIIQDVWKSTKQFL